MDGWLVVALVVILGSLVGIAAMRVAARLPRAGPETISPADEAELSARFAQIRAAETPRTMQSLACTVQSLVARRVPLRYVRPSAQTGMARLGFADGAVVVARSARPTGIGVLFRACEAGGVHPERLGVHPDHLEVELVWPTGHLNVLVLGRDQAD